MKQYEELCLVSYGQTKSGVSRRILFLDLDMHITFLADPRSLQDMMNEAMHQTMINQPGVFTKTIQNCLTKTLKEGKEEGYVGPNFQPDQPL
jgi:hypothetical protein